MSASSGRPAGAAGLETMSAYRWVILFVAWLAFLVSFIDLLTWANVALSVGGSLGLPVAALGIFVTAFYVGYVICNALGGIASDRIGGRATLAISLSLLAAGTFVFSYTTSVLFGLIAQAVMGLAAGADYASCVKLLVAWFDRTSRGRAMGVLLVASSLGVSVTNAVVPSLAAELGWRAVYRVLGVVTLLVAGCALVLLRDLPAGAARGGGVRASPARLLANRNLLLLGLVGFAGLWGTWGFAFWANALMVKGRGLTSIEAGAVMSLVGIAAIIGKPLIGWLSDLLGGRCKWLAFATFVLFMVMLLAFGSLSTPAGFAMAAPLVGLGAFLYSPLMAAMVAQSSGPALAGSAAGVLAGFWQLGSVIVPVVVGMVFQATGSFLAAFATLACGPLLAAIGILFVREGDAVIPMS